MKRQPVCAFCALLLAGSFSAGKAQDRAAAPDSSRTSIFERVTRLSKRSQVFNLNLEMHAGFYADFASKRLDEAAFRMKDLKIDITGDVTDRLFYWYRQRLNGNEGSQPLENLPESIEYAYIGYRLSDRFTLTAGKQDVFFGGFEYDPNPLEIYEYSDMNEYILSYLTGIGLAYQATPSQEIRLQVTNSRMGALEDDYGRMPDGFSKPRVPLFYTLNWNSSYFDEQVNLRYSASAAAQAKGRYMYAFFAGQNLDLAPWYAYFDVMYTCGALDPLGLLTDLRTDLETDNGNAPETPEETAPETLGGIVPGASPYIPAIADAPQAEEAEPENAQPVRLQHGAYLSLVAEVKYRFHPKWQCFAKGMYETASLYRADGSYEKGRYRTAWGYQGGIEFYPMADDNLHLFLLASGRTYRLTQRADALGALALEPSARIAIGFVYQLPLY